MCFTVILNVVSKQLFSLWQFVLTFVIKPKRQSAELLGLVQGYIWKLIPLQTQCSLLAANSRFLYLHFFVFWHMQLYMSWCIISFLALSLLLKYSLFFSSTPVLTSSIDVVFVLFTNIYMYIYIYIWCAMSLVISGLFHELTSPFLKWILYHYTIFLIMMIIATELSLLHVKVFFVLLYMYINKFWQNLM